MPAQLWLPHREDLEACGQVDVLVVVKVAHLGHVGGARLLRPALHDCNTPKDNSSSSNMLSV
jgi:hypothetical protein